MRKITAILILCSMFLNITGCSNSNLESENETILNDEQKTNVESAQGVKKKEDFDADKEVIVPKKTTVTEVVYDDKVELMIVVSNTVEGTLEDLYDNTYEIDGNEYKVVETPYYNNAGKVEELTDSDADTMYDSYFEEEVVTAYVNFAGEVVAVVGESEATGAILGIVTEVASTTDEDSDDVEYLKVRILTEDGSNKT